MLRYSFTVFLGAFLLFAVQLLLGKYFLPWFGGTPAMWTTCMLFFQVVLLMGYLYAHVSATWLRHSRQVFFHLAVLSTAVLALVCWAIAWHEPLMPDLSWRPISAAHPMWAIAVLLTVSAGLPYLFSQLPDRCCRVGSPGLIPSRRRTASMPYPIWDPFSPC